MSYLTIERLGTAAACLSILAGSATAQDGGEETKRSWTIRAEAVHTATGDVIEDAFVQIQDGRIAAMGPGGPSGGDILEVAAVTPGLIDLSIRIDSGRDSVEEVHESTPWMPVAMTLDLFDPEWKRELESGVTTGVVAPNARNVIGGLSAALKTGGEPTLEGRLLEKSVGVSAIIGTSPSSGNRPAFIRPSGIYNRRPTTRMGVEWEARKAFYDALVAREDETQTFPGAEELHAVLDGRMPLIAQAATTQDIRTTLMLKAEFELPNVILDSAAEAWKEPEMLQRSGASVVLPPFSWDGRTDIDGGFMAWDTAARLAELGVPFAFSGHGSSNADNALAMQPTYAIRGGLDPAAALAAVTITPARMVGIDDRVGSIEVGKHADLCLWNGPPFHPTSTIVGVLLEGELIVDPRQR
ncbi:MAG: amidohydrolase family protein [Planctomycetota bacterium]|jgi:imidazolonepropionase-like amidohydrolase